MNNIMLKKKEWKMEDQVIYHNRVIIFLLQFVPIIFLLILVGIIYFFVNYFRKNRGLNKNDKSGWGF